MLGEIGSEANVHAGPICRMNGQGFIAATSMKVRSNFSDDPIRCQSIR
jgi:hypothetical protein